MIMTNLKQSPRHGNARASPGELLPKPQYLFTVCSRTGSGKRKTEPARRWLPFGTAGTKMRPTSIKHTCCQSKHSIQNSKSTLLTFDVCSATVMRVLTAPQQAPHVLAAFQQNLAAALAPFAAEDAARSDKAPLSVEEWKSSRPKKEPPANWGKKA